MGESLANEPRFRGSRENVRYTREYEHAPATHTDADAAEKGHEGRRSVRRMPMGEKESGARSGDAPRLESAIM